MVTSEFNPESDEIDVGDVDQRDNVVKRRLLTTEELVAQCLLFLLAGYETTSTTLAYIMYEMSVNPEAQKKLQEEIDEHFPENVSWYGCYVICSIITFLYWPTCSWLDFNTLFLYFYSFRRTIQAMTKFRKWSIWTWSGVKPFGNTR